MELIDELRREVGTRLQAQRWTARERDAPEVSRPLDAGELATFARSLKDGFTATAIFVWTREDESDWLAVAGGLCLEYGPARDLLARLTGSEILGVMLNRPTVVVKVRDVTEVAEATNALGRFVSEQAPQLERLADVEQLIELLRQGHAVPFAAHMVEFFAVDVLDPEPDDSEPPDAGAASDQVELIAALLAGAGRYDEARQALVEATPETRERNASREHRRFVRQLTRFLDTTGELSLPTTPPCWPPRPTGPEPPLSPLQVFTKILPEGQSRQEAIKAVRAVSQGKSRDELRTLLEEEVSKRNLNIDPGAVETQVDLIATEHESFGKARIALRALKAAGELARSWRQSKVVPERPLEDSETKLQPQSKRKPEPTWIELPDRAAYPVAPRIRHHLAAVELDPVARPWLDRLTNRGIVEVWLAWDTESPSTQAPLNVYVGARHVGRLDSNVASHFRRAMEAAAERDEDPWTYGYLSVVSGDVPSRLEVALPEPEEG
jgi:hypothetical protein